MEIEGVEDLGTRALMADRERRETDAGEISMSSWIFHSSDLQCGNTKQS